MVSYCPAGQEPEALGSGSFSSAQLDISASKGTWGQEARLFVDCNDLLLGPLLDLLNGIRDCLRVFEPKGKEFLYF